MAEVTRGAAPAANSITIRLNGPGMTLLHRAGVAGLRMTLESLQKRNGGQPCLADGTWSWTPDTVTLSWKGEAKAFFQALFSESFATDGDGFFRFAAFGNPIDHAEHAVVLQEALLGTFLQHGLTRTSDPAAAPQGATTVLIDEEQIPLTYHRVTAYAHQKASLFAWPGDTKLAGWLMPGGAVRHTGLGQNTALAEPPERALALWFAPVGAIFFEIRQRGGKARAQYSIVVPEVTNLDDYVRVRRRLVEYGVRQLHASGSCDAGYRVLVAMRAAGLMARMKSPSCRVVSFGKVAWSTQQKCRVNVQTVRAHSDTDLQLYEICLRLFPARAIKKDGEFRAWGVPQVPDLIAANISAGAPWWSGFAEFVSDAERRDQVFNYEKGGLAAMVEECMKGPEQVFVMACHEAWSRRLGQIAEKAKREGSSFRDQASREFSRMRIAFSRCKNAATTREALTDFWSRAGSPLPSLKGDGWKQAITLLDEKHWRQAKDLALLSLASYKGRSEEEDKALASEPTDTAEEGAN